MIEWEAGKWKSELAGHEGPLVLFVHTPLCGTCKVAKRMLEVAEAMVLDVPFRGADLNLMPGLAERFRIESVPCLLLRLPDGSWDKQYRFGSVVELAGRLKPLQGGEENNKMIKLHQLTLRRGERDILRGVDLHIRDGEHWVLLGRNGCGKTTLLEMVTGYMFPTSGTVDVLGNRFGQVDVREVRKQIGYISPSLIEKLVLRDPVWEIVVGGINAYLRVYEQVSDEVRQRAQTELERVGLGALSEQPFGTLSQGERKKVLLARTMMADPRLLILDEPCAGLDLYEREKFLDALQDLSVRKMSMMYVTHHIEEIVPMFTHIALMAEGRIVAAGPKREVLNPDLLRGAYDLPIEVEWQDERPWIRVVRER